MVKVLYFNLLSQRSTLCRATPKVRILSDPWLERAHLREKSYSQEFFCRLLSIGCFWWSREKYLAHLASFKISVQGWRYRDIEFPWRSSAVDLPQRDIILSYANRGERGDNENLFRRFRVPCRACERCSLYLAAHTNTPHAWTPAPSHITHIYRAT